MKHAYRKLTPTPFVDFFRQLGPAFFLAVVAFPAVCAAADQTKIVKWQEEVKLSTGEVIVVERETRFKGGGNPFQGVADLMTIRFRYPADAKEMIEWGTVWYGARGYFSSPETSFGRDIGPGKIGPNVKGYSPEYPLVLDVEKGMRSIYLITLAAGKGACDEYFRYRYDNGQWHDDMLHEVFETQPSNLFLDAEKLTTPNYVNHEMVRDSGKRKNIRFHKIGPDRCLCGTINNPVKSGCMQKYQANPQSTKE